MVAILALLLAVAPALVSAATIDVQVGPGGQLLYDPQNVAAQPGDQVVFHFTSKNHTVTQTSFGDPCKPLTGGINSGFVPVAAGAAPRTFTIAVNDTTPIWLYCAQGAGTNSSHCQAGMVFAINCGADGTDTSFANFLKAARASGGASPSSYTIPPSATPVLVTQPVTLGSEIWTTTYSSYPGSPAPTPNANGPQVHRVVVGGPGKLFYEPSNITASPRDIVVFEFQQKNHTITQSTFENPCRRLNATTPVTGFDSGFMPVADSATTFPTYNFTVNTTAPTWAYCRQTTHCGVGMVFAINSDESPGSVRTFKAFQDLAKAINGSTSTSSATSPSSTSSTGNSTSDASQIKFGFAAMLFPLTFLLGSAL